MPGRLPRLGPGLLVAAAFIGPGTVTTASVAGARFGESLLWALAFAVLAAIVLQEMSARLGLVTREGLGEALRRSFPAPLARVLVGGLVVAALGLGNAAFQMGNVTGASIGLESLTDVPRAYWSLLVGTVAFALLASGVYKWIERFLVTLVALMAVVFPVTAVVVGPDWSGILRGILVPSLPTGSALTVVALIGTTVVPYNLFLHASAMREKWPAATPMARALRDARLDTALSIVLGGIVTLSVVVTAAFFFERGSEIENAATMARQLEPLLGPAAGIFFAMGLLAAGLTSSITAPLAAAYATAGVLGWDRDLRAFRFRAVWGSIVIVGTLLALLDVRPIAAIVFAQAANGVMLPVVAILLLVVSNREALVGSHRNGLLGNLLGGAVVLVVTGLATVQLLRVAGILD